MADLSAISALSSLSEKDLYYQYLINNNSTSTMLNALSGSYSQDSGGLGLSGLMGSISQAYSSSALSSLLGTSSGLYGSGSLGQLGAISSFSSILKLYLNAETTEAGNMAQKLSDALEDADEAGESQTSSYKTVQEIYQYFLDKSQAAARMANNNTSSSTASTSQAAAGMAQAPSAANAFQEFDFDSYIENIEGGLASKLPSAGNSLT
ncbi:MAG: hypothetical protein OSJ45_10955 [Lachnospiraceae bacterium]|nr:hypothetical protein [Lachnospiraceae bacterium]